MPHPPSLSPGPAPDDPAAPEPDYDENGVDLTLIRWMLSLTPAERLQVLQSNIDAFWRLRGARREG